MVAPKPTSTHDEWLTLEKASKRLGVHAATLRRWADQGVIGVFLTPGGHRRFLIADVEQFAREHHHDRLPTPPERQWADRAVALTRQSLLQQRWLAPYDDTERSTDRQLGRQLMGLILQNVARSDEDPELLSQARSIGQQHARQALAHHQPLPDLLQAVSFFRTALLEAAILDAPAATSAQPDANVRLLRRIERVLSEVEAGIVEPFVAGAQR